MNWRLAVSVALLVLVATSAVSATTHGLGLDTDGVPTLRELGAGTDTGSSAPDRDGGAGSREVAVMTDPGPTGTSEPMGPWAGLRAPSSDPLVDDVARNWHDTDGDGIDDRAEREEYHSDPTAVHSDPDTLPDGRELAIGSDPVAPDTDGDGLYDGREVDQLGSDPTEIDTDADGLYDGREVNQLGTDPAAPDTDGDGLTDGQEVTAVGTDPTDPDTDGDGLLDGDEAAATGPVSAGDPLRKDVFVEVDYMPQERPADGAFDPVIAAFADSPVENPDGSTGMTLHVVVDEPVPWAEGTAPDDLDRLMDQHFQRAGDGYHYGVAVHDVRYKDRAIAGFTRNPAHQFAFQVRDEDGRRYPSRELAGLFMHELGHSLGLEREAFRGIDAAVLPYREYRSVMNYNSPDNAVRYSAGDPFDDWAYLEEHLFTPPVERPSATPDAD